MGLSYALSTIVGIIRKLYSVFDNIMELTDNVIHIFISGILKFQNVPCRVGDIHCIHWIAP